MDKFSLSFNVAPRLSVLLSSAWCLWILGALATHSSSEIIPELIHVVKVDLAEIKNHATFGKRFTLAISGQITIPANVKLKISAVSSYESTRNTPSQPFGEKVISLLGGVDTFSETLVVPCASFQNRFRIVIDIVAMRNGILVGTGSVFRSLEIEFAKLKEQNSLTMENCGRRVMKDKLFIEHNQLLNEVLVLDRDEYGIPLSEAIAIAKKISRLLWRLIPEMDASGEYALPLSVAGDSADAPEPFLNEPCREKLVKVRGMVLEQLAKLDRVECIKQDLADVPVLRRRSFVDLCIERIKNTVDEAKFLVMRETMSLEEIDEYRYEKYQKGDVFEAKWAKEFPDDKLPEFFVNYARVSSSGEKSVTAFIDCLRQELYLVEYGIYALDSFPDLAAFTEKHAPCTQTHDSTGSNPDTDQQC